MGRDLDLSVVIATHNRDSILKETLEHMRRLDHGGIDWELVIVDNNSSDKTKEVIAEFSRRLPIRYLFEPRLGQNCARNRALVEAKLGRIVVFTDDDVVPCEDWLRAIVSACDKWCGYSVFGGKIYVIWPNSHIPKWANVPYIRGLAFAEHDYSESECPYTTALGKYPFSGNFWVRREIFRDGRRFDEAVAWRPRNRILATETVFLKQLSKEGHRFLYTPWAVVGHRITPEQVSLMYVMKRAYSGGRGVAHMRPLCRKELLVEHPILWRLIRIGAIGRSALGLAPSLVPLALQRPEKAMEVMRCIGYNVESLNMGAKHGGESFDG